MPVVDKAHADLDSAPGEGDEREPDLGANTAEEDIGGELEDDVGDEEDEGDDGISGADVELEL